LHHAADGENPDGFELLDVLLPDAEVLKLVNLPREGVEI
jgi:hypothetical protein